MASAMPAIDQLAFKGSHNSYDCRRDASLVTQLDDFGCWALELDFSVPLFENAPFVGHDGVGQAADGEDVCGGAVDAPDRFRLLHFLREIRRSQAIRYRPVFVYLEKKVWLSAVLPSGRADDPRFDDHVTLLNLLDHELIDAFGPNSTNVIFGPRQLQDFLATHAGRYPTVPELAGKIVPIAISHQEECVPGSEFIFHDGLCPPGCTDRNANEVRSCREFRISGGAAEGCSGLASALCLRATNQVVRVDAIQHDDSYAFGVPPNPIVVDANAAAETALARCRDSTEDPLVDVTARAQGTFRLAFLTVAQGVDRARGIRNPRFVDRDPWTTGFGWTLLLRAGRYRESLRIDFPLRIEKDLGTAGSAVIG